MIELKIGNIVEEEVDAIVNPANSLGVMGGGVALAIKKAGGEEIEREAMSRAPIKIGEAIATSAGKLKCKYVIHSPTMERPAMKTTARNVKLATRAALKLARELGISKIAFPSMGTGVGGLSPRVAARAMISEFRKFEDLHIVIVAFNEEIYKAFEDEINTSK
ncbi:MAG: macro domain-containing protein [Candidatus Nanoarchaeia archaeon]|nr:macro domain-containing protein [Candidatus Haiyanarchaeum thermophilum]MCW1303230.1 macro domain-containing protein [Candidatus Haiyanarchaeum thermophilum]MCW1304039.1 macro domain-containing protein [Candidatus Haiyanarchaeum thermophilum]MCW1306778.1 macro domain-containing protein [Candidatus Haiyanarchaeum thermophilum]MCW1307477.1 macro domain-containing protein [Candidatus Haiyanarchaeum thermophilum]